MIESIRTAQSDDDFAAFAGLVRDYVAWCRIRYADEPAFVDQVFGHQSLQAELDALQSAYTPPRGHALIARQDGIVCGAVAYRRFDAVSCEMKRLYVAPDRVQGRGLGRRLCSALIVDARAEGHACMRLDTADRMTEAIGLYTALGFVRCPAYRAYPPALMRHLVFMARPLADAAVGDDVARQRG